MNGVSEIVKGLLEDNGLIGPSGLKIQALLF
jgi:hypothetical protein